MALMFAALLMAAGLPNYDSLNPAKDVILGRYTEELHACQNAPQNGGLSSQVQCMDEEVRRQDVALNAILQKVMAHLDVPRRAALQTDQRQWIKAREKSAREAVDPQMIGAGVSLLYDQSYLDETIRRTIWLEKLR